MNTNGVVYIEMNSDTLVLPVNPSQSVTQDIRTTVVQTLGGAYLDKFGLGLQQVQLSGNTAFNSPQGKWNGQPIDGNTAGRHLYVDILCAYENLGQQGKNPVMKIYDDAFGRAWQVEPIGQLQLTRSPSDPMTLNYTQTFVVIKDLINNLPQQNSTSDPVKSIWQTTTSVKTQTTSRVTAASTTATKQKQTGSFKYTVKSGDTLWTISEKYLPKNPTNSQVQAEINKIVAENKLRNANLIFVGQVLTIPA